MKIAMLTGLIFQPREILQKNIQKTDSSNQWHRMKIKVQLF